MDTSELKLIRSNLDVFLHEFDDCIKTAPSREHLRTYTGGQLSDLERKSVVTVNLGYNSRDFHALVDTDLYLPQETWDEDRERCRKAGIPDDVGYRPKWRIALDLLNRSMDNGMQFKWLTADELYGGCGEFRHGVTARGLHDMVEVPRNTYGWLRRPATLGPADGSGMGRPRTRTTLSPGAPSPRRG